jgi:ABC-type polysaccharide/polyol phosphate export permease
VCLPPDVHHFSYTVCKYITGCIITSVVICLAISGPVDSSSSIIFVTGLTAIQFLFSVTTVVLCLNARVVDVRHILEAYWFLLFVMR